MAASTCCCSTTAAPTAGPIAFFKQMPDGRFQDMSNGSRLDFAGYQHGRRDRRRQQRRPPRRAADAQYGGIKEFLDNRRQGTFTDVTREAGLEHARSGARRPPSWTPTATAGLDLVVVNYVGHDPSVPCRRARRGQSDLHSYKDFPGHRDQPPIQPRAGRRNHAGRFKDVTAVLRDWRPPLEPGLGVVCARFQRRRLADILRGQRRPAQPPVMDESEERHVQGGSSRRGAGL